MQCARRGGVCQVTWPGAAAERQPGEHPCASGFTLTELLVGLSIATLLTGLALPAWTIWLAEQRVQIAGSRLVQALVASRRAAIATGASVRLCAVAVDSAAVNTCATQRDWARGWLSLLVRAGVWQPLRESGPLDGVRVEVNAAQLQEGVIFDARGFATQVTGGFAAGSWMICARGARVQVVTLAPSGRTRISTGATCA